MGSFDFIPEIVAYLQPQVIIDFFKRVLFFLIKEPFLWWINAPVWVRGVGYTIMFVAFCFFSWFLWKKRWAWQHVRA